MKTLYIPIIIVAIILASCNVKKPVTNSEKEQMVDLHNSMNSLDWNGTYQATLPCADCEGIKTVLTLNNDLTFIKKYKYLSKLDTIFEDKGSFSWNKTGQIITLNNNNHEQYFVGENRIWKLDENGNKISGNLAEMYILKKDIAQLTDRHWNLIELNGKKIEYNKKAGNQPYIILRPDEENKVYGNAGCNRFFGSFELKEGNGITFSQMGATKMYCSSMEIEDQFLKVLNTADNYSINGDTMTLNKARMAPLAKFEVAYFN
ncbi:META domain-containing protein [Aureibaculum marinum]|uniref:META domain-containing protein n=1 Tax=Aureibaculum marinum TaxID=2487930 RepID=A0A3N4NAB1_9FLAO|nr:copper resistance protein NlpE N-terminal domain-containing protein [Aureibaculum marinum]RPD93294.1 META domain-containing protein [Aureibaculum marinum]